ncbi:MAG: diacylglycerol kinase family protein [Chitinophagales bacterium]
MTIAAAFQVAFKGLGYAIHHQRNIKIHLLATGVVVAAGWYTALSRWEWCAVLLCCAAVISLELMNTALETLTDLVSPHYHELAGRTKDVAAAAVLVFSLFSIVIAAIIFIPHFLS